MPKALPVESIESASHVSRGMRVILDADPADFHGVATKALQQAVLRNYHLFPKDFTFQLNAEEVAILRSQIVTSSLEAAPHGGRRSLSHEDEAIATTRPRKNVRYPAPRRVRRKDTHL